jgi:hypothetical protein
VTRRRLQAAALATSSAALLLAGCATNHGKPQPSFEAYTAHGLTVRLPPGWHRAERSLTPHLSDPREVLAVATYPLHYRDIGCSHVASSALEDLRPTDAFVTLQERGRNPRSSWRGFPRRPARFGPGLGTPSAARECVPSARLVDHWFGFSDHGRHFHVDVAFGPKASAKTRRDAWDVLNTLKVDPNVRPSWRSGD